MATGNLRGYSDRNLIGEPHMDARIWLVLAVGVAAAGLVPAQGSGDDVASKGEPPEISAQEKKADKNPKGDTRTERAQDKLEENDQKREQNRAAPQEQRRTRVNPNAI